MFAITCGWIDPNFQQAQALIDQSVHIGQWNFMLKYAKNIVRFTDGYWSTIIFIWFGKDTKLKCSEFS